VVFDSVSMFDTILVPLDGSKLAERVLLYAPALTRGTSAQLLLLRALDHHLVRRNGTSSAHDYLVSVKTELEQDGSVACYVFAGPAPNVILDTAHLRAFAGADIHDLPHRRTDLILMATHGRSGFGRWIYGSVAANVLASAEMPVMLVPPFSAGLPEDRQAQILVGLDGSPMAEEGLAPAAELATALNAKLVVLRVVEDAASGNDAVRAAGSYLERVVECLPAGLRGRTETMATSGGLLAEVGRLAGNRQLDAVVLTTHGHSGRAEQLMGTAARSILQLSAVPVLLVRPLGIRRQYEPSAAMAHA
jgi:nucleotide-binding universal stress UspA family protein